MTMVLVILLFLVVAFFIYTYVAAPKFPPETDAIIDAVINGDLPEIIVGQTGYASSDGLDIWYECVSPAGATKGTVLLLMGLGGDGLMWPPKFVRGFVEAGYQLIRYDHRGTGMSDWVQSWNSKNPYSLVDMAADVTAVLDKLEVAQAHLVGLSMGGMIAQEVASHHPQRVASLTLMMTSGFVGDPDLPGLTSRYLIGSFLKGIPLLKYRILGGEKNLIKERLAKTMTMVEIEELDVKETAELVLYHLRKRRGIHMKGAWQHLTAVTISGSRYEKLKTVNTPTLVIHGTADQFIPVAHGRKLVELIPNAKGVWLDGIGHVFPVPDLDKLVKRIISHIESSKASQ